MKSDPSAHFPLIEQESIVYENDWFRIREKMVRFSPDAPIQSYCAIDEGDHVTIVPRTREGLILLVRQYRPAVTKYVLELPGGHVDNGQPRESAWNELVEETGHEPETMIELGRVIVDSGRNCGHLYCYFADNLRYVSPQENGIELIPVTERELLRLVAAGEMTHSLNLSAVFLAMLHGHIASRDA